MDYKEKYDEFLELINFTINASIPDEEPQTIYEPFRYIISAGGKRIRPVLTMIAAGAAGGNPVNAVSAGAALEIMHNFTLVHDDIMDRSPLRRGKPTVQSKWNEAVGIITGDIMIGHAYKLIHEYATHAFSNQIHSEFTNALVEVCEGQAFDMDFNSNQNVTMENYLQMIEKKTAKILEACSVIGAYTASANENHVELLREYSLNMGLAFQIQDDLLDLTAEQAEFGKKTGQDIIEGKKTYLIIKAKEKVKDLQDLELLSEFYEKNGLGEEYIPIMKEMLSKLNVFQDADTAIDLYFQKAEDCLKGLPENSYTGMLHWLLKKLNKRKY